MGVPIEIHLFSSKIDSEELKHYNDLKSHIEQGVQLTQSCIDYIKDQIDEDFELLDCDEETLGNILLELKIHCSKCVYGEVYGDSDLFQLAMEINKEDIPENIESIIVTYN